MLQRSSSSRRLGVHSYILVLLAVMVAGPVVYVGFSLADRWHRSATERVARDLPRQADAVAREVGRLLEHQLRAVQTLAGHAEDIGLTDHARLQRLVDTQRARIGDFSYMYIADRSGRSLITSPPRGASGQPTAGVDYSDRDYYKALIASGSAAISRVQLGRRSRLPSVQIVAPIRGADEAMVGFAEGSVDLDVIQRMASLEAAGETRVVVVDNRRQVIADSARRLEPLRDVSSIALFTRRGRRGGESLEGSDDAGQRVRAAASEITVLGARWSVHVTRPLAAISGEVASVKRRALLVTALALVVALGFTALMATVLARPVTALAAAVRRFGRGELEAEPPPPSGVAPREVVELTAAVAEMMQRLRGETERLEALVSERTANLEAAHAAITHAGESIEITDADGRYVYVNPAFERLTGRQANEVIGRDLADLVELADKSTSTVGAIIATVASGETWRGALVGKRADGTLVHQEATFSPVISEGGDVTHIVAVRRDVSARIQAEAALRISDRMASVGTLAAGVAHEINNPLTYVMGNLELIEEDVTELADKLADDRRRRDLIESFAEARGGLVRVREIVAGLRAFSRGDEESVGPVNVEAVLESCVRMAANEIRHRARLERDYHEIPPVLGNEAKLGQVLLNLLINASQAIEAGAAARNTIKLSTRTDGADGVIIEVSDSGRGIDPEVRPKIFDPFFTTKAIGEGTGLGLSICHGIISAMGGTIGLDSAVGVGTTFRIGLPAAPDSQRTAALADASEPSATAARLLVVDDEPAVGRVMKRMLRGYQVTAMQGADDALSWLARESSVDVVLCDVMMPHTSGIDFYQRLGELSPALQRKVIFISGGAFTPVAQRFLNEVDNPLVKKPFDRVELIRAVERVLVAA